MEIERYYISRDQVGMRKGWELDTVKRFDLETFHFDKKKYASTSAKLV